MAEVDDSSAGPHLADKGWIDVQKNTFKNWVNEKLKDTKCKVEVLEKGFADGITLIKLLEALSKKKMHKRSAHKFMQLHCTYIYISWLDQFLMINMKGCLEA